MAGLPALIVDGASIPQVSAFDIVQSYEWLGGFTGLRMMDGSIKPKFRWKKVKTRISGSGWLPPELANLPVDASIELRCVGIMSAKSATTSITLPTDYRTESEALPKAWGVKAGELISTTYSITNGVATLAAVSGADHYRIDYFPKLTVIAEPMSQGSDTAGAAHNWELSFNQT